MNDAVLSTVPPPVGSATLARFPLRVHGCTSSVPSLLVTSILWAFSFGLIKHHLHGIEPSFIAFSRLGLALLVFVPWMRPRGAGTSTAVELGLLGTVQFGLMYLCYLFAFPCLQAYQVVLLTVVTPIWVCLSDDLWERHLAWRPLSAAILAIVGTAIALGGGGIGVVEWRGVALLQASNMCFAVGQVWYRRLRRRCSHLSERASFGWVYLGAVLATLPFAAPSAASAVAALTWTSSGVLLYLGVLASGVGFFLWNHGATQVSTGVLAVMNNLKTPLGLLASLLVFGESVNLVRLSLGGTIVVLATLYAQGGRVAPSRPGSGTGSSAPSTL